jgi:hypothetical protein
LASCFPRRAQWRATLHIVNPGIRLKYETPPIVSMSVVV